MNASSLTCDIDRTQFQTVGYVLSIDSIELLNDPIYGDYYSVNLALADGFSTYFYSYSLYIVHDTEGHINMIPVWDMYE